jgi:heme-degrading monooxygenase HmoA
MGSGHDKPGKNRELSDAINDNVLPILKKQKGFMDETVLVSDTEANRVLGLSFWNTKEDAERYHREQYPKVIATLSDGIARWQALDAPFLWHDVPVACHDNNFVVSREPRAEDSGVSSPDVKT